MRPPPLPEVWGTSPHSVFDAEALLASAGVVRKVVEYVSPAASSMLRDGHCFRDLSIATCTPARITPNIAFESIICTLEEYIVCACAW